VAAGPGPTLAVAATLADLRVGTWVYASPWRHGVGGALAVATDRGGLAADFLAVREDVELALHVPVVGDVVAPFMTSGTDPAALRAMDSLAILPSDPGAAIEEIVRRREESGFS